MTTCLDVPYDQSPGDDGETGPEAEAAVWEWLVGNADSVTLELARITWTDVDWAWLGR